MTTLTQLYNNIKTFVLQTFESKEEEDINLPIEVERLFRYIDGEMLIVDSPIILELSDNIMKLRITGNSFSTYNSQSTPFIYHGKVFVDWGDDTGLIEYTEGELTHTYSSSDDYTVKIYGDITRIFSSSFYNCTGLTSMVIPSSVISLGDYCFYSCTGLTSISIPNSVTSLGNSCFRSCSNLTSILLNWTETDILTYQSNWITGASLNLKFIIPQGTTEYYVQAGYPSDKLVESD